MPETGRGEAALRHRRRQELPAEATLDEWTPAEATPDEWAPDEWTNGPAFEARAHELPAPGIGDRGAVRRRRQLPAVEAPDDWTSGPASEVRDPELAASETGHRRTGLRRQRRELPVEETSDEWANRPAFEARDPELPASNAGNEEAVLRRAREPEAEDLLGEGTPRLPAPGAAGATAPVAPSPWWRFDEPWLSASGAPASGASLSPAEAPEGDLDELAEKIRRILGEEARRHGIDV